LDHIRLLGFEPGHHSALLGRWLLQPHVVEWWGQRTVAEVLAPGSAENLRLIACGERLLGIIRWRRSTRSELASAGWHPIAAGGVNLDLFIGEAGELGRGIGPEAIRLAIAELSQPEPPPCYFLRTALANERARRAFLKAGFTAETVFDEGNGPQRLMVRTGESPRAIDSAPPRHAPAFSQELRELMGRLGDSSLSIREVLAATRGRGFELLLLLASLPFVTPIPLPGLSTPLGSLVFLVGTRLALGRRPWLPDWVLDRRMPPRFLGAVLGAARRMVRCLEVLLRPRLEYLHGGRIVGHAIGIMIMVSGALLLLPLPFPFSNGLPASTVILLTASAMERDGLCLIAGVGAFVCTIAYFALLVFGGAWLLEWCSHAVGLS
jgi:hypothetical protein